MITLKRVYEEASVADGRRVLVDRLWPRGISREKAKIDLWLKDAAPSDGLRRWFAHDPEKWPGFRKRYRAELASAPGRLDELRRLAAEGAVTLVYAAKDEERNNAVALKDFLEKG